MITMSDFVIIGSGTSLTKSDVDYVQGKAKVIAINDNYKIAPWADILYYCDMSWFLQNIDGVIDFKGEVVTISKGLADTHYKAGERLGLNIAPDVLCTGLNSGYQSIDLAIKRGASRIFLLGYDMKCNPDGKKYWHEDRKVMVNSPFGDMIKAFESIKINIPIINCSRDTALTCFPRASIQSVL